MKYAPLGETIDMGTPKDKDHAQQRPGEKPAPFADAMRTISKENEDLNPADERVTDGPGAPPEGPEDHSPSLTSHTGQTTRGSYATDSSTGAGRYMDHRTGTFGMDPVEDQGEDDAIDPQV